MAFKIHGEITMDGAQFKRALSEASGKTTEFLKSFALGAIGIASLEQAFDKTVESASELVDTSKKLDLTIEQLQVLRQAAEENGLGFDVMTKALERFNAIRENVLSGGKGSADQAAALQRLGINQSALRSQTAAQSLMGQISTTAQHSNAADIANDLKTVFGKNGEELFGVLKTNFSELEDQMKRFGALMDTQTAATLKQFEDEMGLIGRVLLAELAPALAQIAEFSVWFALQLKTAGEFIVNFARTFIANAIEVFSHPANLLLPTAAIGKLFYDAANQAGDQTIVQKGQNDAMFNEFIAAIARMSNQLDNPKPQDTNPGGDPPPTKKRKEAHGREEHSDSLIEVGNFLGSGANSIGTIAQQQLDVSKKQLDVLNKIQDNTKFMDKIQSGVDFE